MARRKRPPEARGRRRKPSPGAGPVAAPPASASLDAAPARPKKALLAAAVALEAVWLAVLLALALSG